jgi:hypothetical protein
MAFYDYVATLKGFIKPDLKSQIFPLNFTFSTIGICLSFNLDLLNCVTLFGRIALLSLSSNIITFLTIFITRLSEILSCSCGEQTTFWGMFVVKIDKRLY